MTLPLNSMKTCAVCGGSSCQTYLASVSVFGSPDLDTRPAPMARHALGWQIQTCPHCGYVAWDIGRPTHVTADFLKTPSYLTCDGLGLSSHVAQSLYRMYLIHRSNDDPMYAYRAALQTAWACDDEQDTENARHCRILALKELAEFEEHPEVYREEDWLIMADLLRRTGMFTRLEEIFQCVTLSGETARAIIAFQREKARQKDTGCYRVCDALGQEE